MYILVKWSRQTENNLVSLTLSKKLFNIYHLVTMYACFVLHCSRMAFWFIRQRKFDSICIQEKKVVCCVNHVSPQFPLVCPSEECSVRCIPLVSVRKGRRVADRVDLPIWNLRTPPTRPPPTPHPDNVINYATYFSSTYFIKLWWSKICSKSLYRLHYSFPRRDEMLQRFTSFAYLCLKLPTTDPHTETSLRRSNAIKISDSFC